MNRFGSRSEEVVDEGGDEEEVMVEGNGGDEELVVAVEVAVDDWFVSRSVEGKG